ncbi:cytochrome c oxidase assembly protein [Humibacter ginsenosidimutans]|uniref:Cytochrome c oxidase assembly protein n=1 Tax=Humibacter ginsenosidimutans TaxID=2599293 RepID=A0A5B8M3E6_9MICO|nr:cytochrome c oxidase assembly protein [Humibacter ginsenosidimutans]
MIVVAAALYGIGLFSARRNGTRWPAWPTVAFYVFGLGSYAWIEFGFLGTWSTELRWAFTTRVAFLLFVVPGLLALGRPVSLARAALSGTPARVLDRILTSWPVRLMGNAIFAPVVALVGFCLFLTPFAAALRLDPGWEAAITIGVPLVGLLMVLPVTDSGLLRTSLFITAEFMLAFVELVLDAIPGILLRLNESVLDHATALSGALPSWFPTALHDQHLSGDFLWFIAEIADIPVLIILFLRWMHTDKREAKQMDDLTDEQMEQLTQEHLKRFQR